MLAFRYFAMMKKIGAGTLQPRRLFGKKISLDQGRQRH